ncbi:sulfotransferase family 2 domain-containing protein [Desulfogranum marinum]|uniref:sulfotransferase family 2 domain-containing protein n=1 Tax=Desulfogranum marinum TaxID=453220 RepID=UPI0019643F25|nr:sulfotransferase family 2 domain-containing protein [Desulfogranum marinum]MBM9513029.1 sulfotransferase family 2 domain-containing protein [Desulfogranum marinum]
MKNPFLNVFDQASCQYVTQDLARKLVFHHIPKTAGSTFRTLLESFYQADEICPAEVPGELANYWDISDKSKYLFFAGHFSYSSIESYLNDAIWITFLRSPVERLISYYYNVTNKDRVPAHWINRYNADQEWREYFETVQGMDINSFLSCTNPKAKRLTSNRQTQAFIPDSQRLLVGDWSCYDKKLVETAKKNLKNKFCFIGIQEYFTLSVDLFSLIFSIDQVNLENYTKNLNKLKARSSKYDINTGVREEILRKNSMDSELYEYAKSLFFLQLQKINWTVFQEIVPEICQLHSSPAWLLGE